MNTIAIDDIGDEIAPLSFMTVTDEDIKQPTLASFIDLGIILIQNADGNVLTVEESQEYKELSVNFEPTKYFTKAEVLELMSAIRIVNNATSLTHMPIFSVNYNKIRYATYNPDNGDFYTDSVRPYYVFQPNETEQDVIEINGSGYFYGLILPRLKNNEGDFSLTVKLTCDDMVFEEVLTYTEENSKNNRIYIGGMIMSTDVDYDDEETENTVYTNLRPYPQGSLVSKKYVYIPHDNQMKNNPLLPRFPFKNYFKVSVQASDGDLFSTSSYRNRIVPFFNFE